MLRRLFVDSAIYTLATAVSGVGGLAMLPVYTRFLGAADYGVIDLITLLNSLVTVVATLEAAQGLTRFLPEAPDAAARTKIGSTAFWFTAATTAGALGLVALAAPALAPIVLQSGASADLLRLGCAAAFVTALQGIALRHLRGALRPWPFLAATVVTTLVTMSATLILLTRFNLGPAGMLLGQCAGAFAGLALAWRLAAPELSVAWDATALRAMLRFSAPLVVSTLGVLAAGQASRWILAHAGSLEATGLLGIATRITSVIGLAAAGLQQSLSSLIYASHRQAQTPAGLARSFSLFAACGLVCCAALTLFAPEILRVFAAPQFQPAAVLVGPLCAAALLTASTAFAPGLEIRHKTMWVASASLLSGGLNLLLCWWWVPRYGALGAAGSMGVSAAVQVLLIFGLSQRHYPAPHRWGRLVAAFVLAGAAMQTGRGTAALGVNLDFNTVRIALFCAVTLACWLLLVRPALRAT